MGRMCPPWDRRSLAARRMTCLLAGAALLALGCAPEGDRPDAPDSPPPDDLRPRVEATLQRAAIDLRVRADSVDDALQPVPLLTGGEEGELRRHLNEEHLARAQALGISPGASPGDIERLAGEGRLVELQDSTPLWVIRELEFSVPLVTADAHALLEEIGERFQRSLDTLGLPAYRLELTSLLRTAERQRALRGENSNAAAGRSTHEFGTTVDVAYASYAAPAEGVFELEPGEPDWLAPHLTAMAGVVLEAVAARRSREMQAVLGRVILEMQREGKLLATLERQQTVFHLTVARSLAPAT